MSKGPSSPLGEKLRLRVVKSTDKVPNEGAALVKSFYQLAECLGIILIPLLRHLGGESPKFGIFNSSMRDRIGSKHFQPVTVQYTDHARIFP